MKKLGFLLLWALLFASAAVYAEDAEPLTKETAQETEEAPEDPEDIVSGRTNSQVRLRKEPSADSVAISTLEKGTDVFIYQSKSTDDYLYVRCYAPYGKGKAWITGYVMWDYVDETEEEEEAESEEEEAVPGHTNSLVRLRKEPFADAVTLSKLPKDTKVYIYDSVSTKNYLYVRCYASYGKGHDWITGYVMRKYVDLDEVKPEETETPAPEETAAPEETETPAPEETAAPEETETPVPEETAASEETEEAAPEETAVPEEPVPEVTAETEDPDVITDSVASDMIGFGDELFENPEEAEAAEKELGPARAAHTNNLVRMRKEPSRDSITMAKLAKGTRIFVYPAAARDGYQFVKCYAVSGNVSDWIYGYIMDKYVDIEEEKEELKPNYAVPAPEATPEPEQPEETPEPEKREEKPEETPAELGPGRQGRATMSVRVRKEPDPKSMAVAKLYKDAVVYVFDERSTDDYWYIKCVTGYGGTISWVNGYVQKKYINAAEAVVGAADSAQETDDTETPKAQALKQGKTIAEVRLRQEPASYSPTVSVLSKNTEIWVDESASTAHYWFVKCYSNYFEGDKDWVTGYILKDYAEVDPQ